MWEARISAILPVYCPGRFEENIVKSIFGQNELPDCLYLVDDDHSDEARGLIKRLEAENSKLERLVEIIVLRTPSRGSGPAVARNLALNKVSDGYLAFLDCDDFWHPDFLKIMQDQLRQSHHNVAVCSYKFVQKGRETEVVLPRQYGKEELLQTNILAMPCVMLDLRRMKLAMFPNRGHEDYGFWLSNLGECQQVLTVRDRLVTINKQANSLSSDIKKSATWHWKLLRGQKLGLIATVVLFVMYLGNAVLKRYTKSYSPVFLPRRFIGLLRNM